MPLTAIHPNEAINSAAGALQALAMRAGATLKVRHRRTAGCLVQGDMDGLQQVLINLISNAIKYNDSARPEIQITTRVQGERYLVEVQDNGPGIAPDQLEHIFTKFGRSWRQTPGDRPPADRSGTGLGLAISRQLVERFGGRLSVQSALGQGALFTVELPLAAAQVSANAGGN